MNSSLFSLCFETDTTLFSSSYKDTLILDESKDSGASGNGIPNKDAFTITNILNLNTRIIPNKINIMGRYNILK